MNIAFIGLGIMGKPMAARLVSAGYEVCAVVRSDHAIKAAEAAGMTASTDLEGAVRTADVVVTMLPDTPDVMQVIPRAVAVAPAGALFIDMSTIDPGATRELHQLVVSAGCSMLDAPVSGGETGAIEGVLSVMVGGAADDFARARPVLETMGTTIVHVGPAGAGQVVKAANQMVVAGNIAILAEALVFLDAHDVALDVALDVLSGGLAGSTVLSRKRAAFLEYDFRPGFRLQLHAKDLGIVEAAARGAGIALPTTALVAQLVRALVARGDGALDHSALYKLAAELNADASGALAGLASGRTCADNNSRS